MRLLLALGLAGVLVQAAGAQSTGAISGRVLEDGTQTPIAAADVTLMPVRARGASMPLRDEALTAVTDREGRFVFEGIAPGEYRVMAQKAGFARFGGPEPPPVANVRAGERRADVNITLRRGGVIAGRVLDEEGRPVADARVLAMQKMPPYRGSAAGPMRLMPAGGTAPTNDLGEYRLYGLPPGEYYVQAQPRSSYGPSSRTLASNSTTELPTYFPNVADSQSAHPLNVAAGQTVGDVDIRMVSVPAFQVSGVVTDDAGRPMGNVLVKLVVDEPRDGPVYMMGRPHNQTHTDASGKFTIGNVTAGTYTLLAAPPVVIAREVPVGGGVTGSGSVSMRGSVGASISGSGTVTTETRNGITVQFRDDTATRLTIAVGHADVRGLEVSVRPPSQ